MSSDDDISKPIEFNPHEIQEQDDFVLNEDSLEFDPNQPSTSKTIPPISNKVLNRFDIENNTGENADLLDAHLVGVSAYDANRLESGFIQQVTLT